MSTVVIEAAEAFTGKQSREHNPLLSFFVKRCTRTPTLYTDYLVNSWRAAQKLPNLREDDILSWAYANRDAEGNLPGMAAAITSPAVEQKIRHLNQTLLFGFRGLTGGMDLPHLYYKHGLISWKPPITEQFVLTNIIKFFLKHNRLPLPADGAIEGLKDQEWVHMSRWGKRYGIGSLRQVYVRYGFRMERLTEDAIIEQAKKFHALHGRLPGAGDGLLPDYIGEDFHSINIALRQGDRGLGGGLSLDKLYIKHGLKLGELSEEIIIHHALRHFEKHGKLPNQYSGPVEGFPGESWRGWYNSLKEGTRNLGGGLSLEKLYIKHGLRFETLNADLIFALALEHLKYTGEFPNKNSGSVFGYPGENWHAIHTALNKGNRDLPGGDTLAQLLIRKLEEQMQKHMDQTGFFPDEYSGCLPDHPETMWGAVHLALKKMQISGKQGLNEFIVRIFAKSQAPEYTPA